MENRVHKREAAKCHTVSRSTEAKMNSSKKTLKVVILGDAAPLTPAPVLEKRRFCKNMPQDNRLQDSTRQRLVPTLSRMLRL